MTPPPTAKQHRLAQFLVERLPVILIRDTERVMLNAGTGTVGVTSLMALRESGTIADSLDVPQLVAWSVTLILGSVFVLVGMSRGYRTIERAGLMLTAIGCVTYAAALLGSGQPRAQIVGVLFLCIAAAKVVRLLVSSVSNAADGES